MMSVDTTELKQRLYELEEAIDSGVLTYRDTDGKSMTYRSLAEMEAARSRLQRRISAAATPTRRRAMGVAVSVDRGV